MLIIFDIDGTLCQTNAVDTECFIESVRVVTGIDLGEADWNDYPEVTDTALIEEILKDRSQSEIDRYQGRILEDFMERLTARTQSACDRFQSVPGAVEFFKTVRDHPDFDFAIATGGWDVSARLKLQTGGFTLEGVPLASASDHPRRTEIIRLAANRAGRPLSEAVYFGDGFWDLRACQELDMPLIGIGAHWESLKKAGAIDGFLDYSNREEIFVALDGLSSRSFLS